MQQASISMSGHLISDAEFYILSAEKLANFQMGSQFNVYIEGKPFVERNLLLIIFYLSQFFNIPLEIFSLWLSRFTHLVFAISVFRTLQSLLFRRRTCFRDKFNIINRNTHLGGNNLWDEGVWLFA